MADVLVVEDEPRMRDLLAAALADEGHRVGAAPDGVAALLALRRRRFDAAAIDVALPGTDGIELCRPIRREGLPLAIVLVTARDAGCDRIAGLDAGADDHLVKPVALDELAARLRALLRRTATACGRLEAGDLVLDPLTVRASVDGRTVLLSVEEFGLLRVLVGRRTEVLDRRTILAAVRGDPDRFEAAIVDQYVGSVREKLAASGSSVRIEAVRGVGYGLVNDGDPSRKDPPSDCGSRPSARCSQRRSSASSRSSPRSRRAAPRPRPRRSRCSTTCGPTGPTCSAR